MENQSKYKVLAYRMFTVGILGLFLFLGLSPTSAYCEPSVAYPLAFYYGTNAPINQLKLYPQVVVDPGSGVSPAEFNTSSRKLFAYASLGEAISLNQYKTPINPQWVIGKNTHWQSLVLDQTNPAWQAFFLQEVITPLWDAGFRGFFLDTLDSYRLASEDPVQMKKQQQGLITIIRCIKTKYPDASLIFNRGFEILPEVHTLVDGVVVESLFAGWNNAKKRYVQVSKKQRDILVTELNKIQNQYRIPVTAVDYLSPTDKAKAPEVARKIKALGFNAWVTNGILDKLYLTNATPLPRKILLLYQGTPGSVDERIGSYLSNAVAMSLNYLGYVTVLHNMQESLPDISADEYVGIITAPNGLLVRREKALRAWYVKQMDKKIPLVVLNNFGFTLSEMALKRFGLSYPLFTYSAQSVRTVMQSPLIGYEMNPSINAENFIPVTLKKGQRLLSLVNELGVKADLAGLTPWGGYFLTTAFLVPVTRDNYRWAIDPFAFFKKALRLPDRPAPDVTTENGSRLFFAHVDGDGFANKGEWNRGDYVGEVLRKEILEFYKLPVTISIVQGEIASNGINPTLTPVLEPIARRIFALPYVEIGSHTYSHPYIWDLAASYKGDKVNPYTLPIAHYRFNVETEVRGSVDYINQHLAPPNKKCKMFLWSGEGDVPEKALAITKELGLGNINPGTLISRKNNSLTQVSSFGLNEGPYFQVFAPIGNDQETLMENGRFFYSLIGLIDALKLTDMPRRLKPIDIYYHFFTLGQLGGIKALRAVYDWTLTQAVMPIYASEYYSKVIDANQMVIAQQADGWIIETQDKLRELRIPRHMGYPDLSRSQHIMGYSTYNEDVYIHISPGGEALVYLSKTAPTLPYLVSANTRVKRFERTAQGFDLVTEVGYLPLVLTLGNMAHCAVFSEGKIIEPEHPFMNEPTYRFNKESKNDFSIRCE